MKKQILVGLAALLLTTVSYAQVDFSKIRFELAGNYTSYRGDFREKTTGIKFRASLPINEKFAAGLGFTYHLPIKVASTASVSDGSSTTTDLKFNFKTITLDGNYFFSDEKTQGFTPYANLGIGLVLVNWKESLTGTVPAGETVSLSPGESLSGFTINFGLGAQYSFGRPMIFADAGLALPGNQVNNTYVYNPIPAHLVFNVGCRFALNNDDDR